MAALNHPNVCTLYDVGPDYLVMEYVEGTPVKGPLPLEQAIPIAVQIAAALDAAHRRGIIHRDLMRGQAAQRAAIVLLMGLLLVLAASVLHGVFALSA